MTYETKFRLPRLPHLPTYKTAQNQVDEYQTRKDYEEEFHRALQEGLIQIDSVLGPGGSGPVSITATAPVVATPSTIVNTGTISITDFVASGASHARGTVPDPGNSAGTTKFLREDATWQVPSGGATSGSAIVMAKVFGRI